MIILTLLGISLLVFVVIFLLGLCLWLIDEGTRYGGMWEIPLGFFGITFIIVNSLYWLIHFLGHRGLR